MGLKEKLHFETQFLLEDFPEIYQSRQNLTPDSHKQLMLSDESYQEIYDKFCEIILDGIDKKIYIPVYRLADGEFNFIETRLANGGTNNFLKSFKQKMKYLLLGKKAFRRKIEVNKIEILKNLFDPNYSFNAYGEIYTKRESKKIKRSFIDNLNEISKNGYLALHFVKKGDNLVYSKAISQFLDWVDRNKIDINEKNYLPFYHVYAILTGKFRKNLFENREILIVTSYDLTKKKLLEEYLYNKEYAKKVSFIRISSNKSMIDIIDVNQFIGKIDLVIVGAGIGSANILMQLKPLSVPCIDAGYALECMANNNLRRDRMFLELK